MTDAFLYLTTIGHKTGNPHEIEIWYVDNNDRYYLCAEHREKTHWVQNVLANPQVTFSVGSRQNHDALVASGAGIAHILDATQEPRLFHLVTQLFIGKYNWSDGTIVEIKHADE